MDDPDLTQARAADVPAIVALMNRAYRGRGADAGWTTETYIEGDRTSEDQLRRDMTAHPHAAILLWRGSAGNLRGSVWMEPEADDVWYLGSLAISPSEQNGGLGRRMLSAAERWASRQGARAIRITVVNVRASLIDWYIRRGYRLSGETEPFPYDDDRFGRPLRDDLQFVVLRKTLGGTP